MGVGAKPLPIEIKSGRIDTHGVTAFLKKFKMEEGLIISRDKSFVHEENGRPIRVVPARVNFASEEPAQDAPIENILVSLPLPQERLLYVLYFIYKSIIIHI